jgi:hypothetical protein
MSPTSTRIASALVALWVALSFSAHAQDALKVLRVADFSGSGIDQGESSALQSLVTSYIIELKMFRVIDDAGQELALKEAETAVQLGVAKDLAPLTADYILSATTDKMGSLLVFTLSATKVSTGEKKTVTDAFSTVNDLILGARRLTLALFGRPQDSAPATGATSASGQAVSPSSLGSSLPASDPDPSLRLVAGTWRGDKNVDRVTILPDGRGFAILASGLRMAVKASIDGAAVVVIQDQPSSPDFYRPSLDLKSARIVAAAARPWRWVFSLSADGNSLNGVKESVFVEVSSKGEVSINNNFVRDASWQRLYR